MTLVAQFFTLFGGLVIIIQGFIQQSLIAAGESDTTVEVSIVTYIVYMVNIAVVGWPAIDILVQTNPLNIWNQASSMFSSCVKDRSVSADYTIPTDHADKVDETIARPGQNHTDTSIGPVSDQPMKFDHDLSAQAAGVFFMAGGVKPLLNPILPASTGVTRPPTPPRAKQPAKVLIPNEMLAAPPAVQVALTPKPPLPVPTANIIKHEPTSPIHDTPATVAENMKTQPADDASQDWCF
jgi:hypothetical protein